MKVTFDSGEDLDKVLQVVGAMYGVRLTVAAKIEPAAEDDQGQERGERDTGPLQYRKQYLSDASCVE